MEYASINRDQSLTIEQQIALLTQRIAHLEELVSELSKPIEWEVIEGAEQFV